MASKEVRSDCSINRINNLPCNVTDLILTYLPLRDVVRTSVLSRQWRHMWLTISDLVFDLDFIEALPENYGVEDVISCILLRHQGPILKFVLKSNRSIKHYAINNWLEYVAEHHHLKYLALELWNDSLPCYVVPQCLFRCQHLRELHLKRIEVRLPSSFNGFDGLVILNLDNIRGIKEVLEILIPKCPMLTSLSISSDGALFLSINNLPNIKCLSVFSQGMLTSNFHLAMLEKISLRDPFVLSHRKMLLRNVRRETSFSHVKKSYVTELFSRLLFIKEVEVDCWAFEFLGVHGVPQKFPKSLHYLTYLKVNKLCLDIIEGVSVVICLIRSAPNLKCLHVSLDSCDEDNLASIQYLKAQQECSDLLSSSLKNVKIENFDSNEHKMEFVKLLLSGTTALENLEIKSNLAIQADTEDMYKMAGKVNSFLRASSKVVVMFDQLDEGLVFH